MKKFFIYAAVFYAGATTWDLLLLNDRFYKIHSEQRRATKASFRARRNSLRMSRQINRAFEDIVSRI